MEDGKAHYQGRLLRVINGYWFFPPLEGEGIKKKKKTKYQQQLSLEEEGAATFIAGVSRHRN